MRLSASFSKPSSLLLQPLVLTKHLLTVLDERLLNIKTVDRHSVRSGQRSPAFGDDEEYSTINYWFIRRIIREAAPGPEDVFYDLGCGMGRVLCMFARRHLRKCVGVEYSRYHYTCCRKNAASLRARHSPVEVRHEDAAKSDIADGTLFYMFNPFGSSTLHAVVGHIRESLRITPRRIMVIYVNPVHRAVLEECGWLHLHHAYRTLFNLHVTFWTNL